MPGETEHILGIVDSFVQHRYRARLRAKPHELVEDLHHTLPSKLDARFVIPLKPYGIDAQGLIRLIPGASRASTAFVIGGFAEGPTGEMPLSLAIDTVETQTAAAASIELGQLVFYKTEMTVGRHGWETDRYLLVRDPQRKESIARTLAKATTRG